MTQELAHSNVLLPSGFPDALPDESRHESWITSQVSRAFLSYGYEPVSPPLVEFERNNVITEESVVGQTFRLMDPASQEMMCIRSDMTMQVARIASMRMKDHPRPLRLCYQGSVLQVQGEGLYSERQYIQAGAELVGASQVDADVEIIVMAVKALQNLGVNSISVDFNLPQLSYLMMGEHGVATDVQQHLLHYIEVKDVDAIMRVGHSVCEALKALVLLSGSADEALPAIKKMKLPAQATAYVSHLEAVVNQVSSILPDVAVTIDPLERRGFEYHSSISFSLFSHDSHEELGRGGRYIVPFNQEDAVGVTLSVSALKRITSVPEAVKRVFVPYDVGFQALDSANFQEYVLVRGLSAIDDNTAEAKRLGCQYLFDQGTILPIA